MNSHTDPETEKPIVDKNPDPVTGAPGSHPAGTGAGAAAAGATGAALGGIIGGPVGAVAGAAIGAVAGGLAGKGMAEALDPTEEDAYWKENHHQQPYATDGNDYDEYADAYRVGYHGYQEGQSFDEREADLEMEYEGGPQKSEEEAAAMSAPAGMPLTPITPAVTMAASRRQGRGVAWSSGANYAARAAYDRVGSRLAAKKPTTTENSEAHNKP